MVIHYIYVAHSAINVYNIHTCNMQFHLANTFKCLCHCGRSTFSWLVYSLINNFFYTRTVDYLIHIYIRPAQQNLIAICGLRFQWNIRMKGTHEV